MGKIRMSRPRAMQAAAWSLLILLAACTTTERAPSPSPRATAARTSSPATLEAEQGLVVNGHHFKAQCSGQGPAVMLVIGYGGTMADWGEVPTRLGATTRTCMYDRLGIGNSDSPPAVQTFEDIADDLDGVISALRLPRPVVVVGHSLGGPIAVSWAARHPRDARALVLLDPTPPGFQAALPSLVPPPDPGDLELTEMIESDRRFDDPQSNLESLDPKSWTAYDRINRIDVPLWVLVAGQSPQLPRAVDAAQFDAAWKAGERRLAGLSSNSHLITAAGADHIIWERRPELVLSSVAEALTP